MRGDMARILGLVGLIASCAFDLGKRPVLY